MQAHDGMCTALPIMFESDVLCIHSFIRVGGRTCYLPDNAEGKKVLAKLQTAWERRLIFAVGTSTTSGRENMTVWAGIHHKTKRDGGASCHGYPDETYLVRVQQELADKGVV